MSTAIDDLWPVEIASVTDEVPPVTILKQQASLLGQKTKNIVEGKVETVSNDKGGLRHTLYLVAPALNFYRYPLIDVEHKVISMYPATIEMLFLEKKLARDVEDDEEEFMRKNIVARNEQEFKDGLKRVFAHKEIKRVIGALFAQSGGKIKIRQGMSLGERVAQRDLEKKTSKLKQDRKKEG